MEKSMKETQSELYIVTLEKLVDKQNEFIELQKKELKACYGLIDKLCNLVGIDSPKWEG